MNNIEIQTNATYAVGDIHGNFNSLISMIKRYDITDSCIIVCGDCGLGFNKWSATKKIVSKLDKLCAKNNITIVMVRGNHDDPNFFIQGNLTPRIVPVPDYTVINSSILCIGGAISIDRKYRMSVKDKYCLDYIKYHPGASIETAISNTPNLYWSSEPPVYDEEKLDEIKEAGLNITTVCTHTCPSFCDPVTKDGIGSWLKADPELETDIDAERKVMDLVYEKLISDGHTVKDWIYGHYHRHSMMVVDNTRFLMLGAVIRETDNVDWVEIC